MVPCGWGSNDLRFDLVFFVCVLSCLFLFLFVLHVFFYEFRDWSFWLLLGFGCCSSVDLWLWAALI